MMEIQCEQVFCQHRGHEFSFLGYPDDHITNMMMPGRLYEADLLDAIYERYGEGGVYYDFGAFIGTHSVFFEKVCKADLVVSVEGNQITANLLMQNIKLNDCKKIEVYNLAVGDISMRCKWVEGITNMGSKCILPSDDIEGTKPLIKSGALITARPKLIKIDVEGATIATLIGCLEAVEQYKPVMVIEARWGEEFDETNRILESVGYKLHNTYCATPTHIWEHKG